VNCQQEAEDFTINSPQYDKRKLMDTVLFNVIRIRLDKTKFVMNERGTYDT
jgi:hypothetical protein